MRCDEPIAATFDFDGTVDVITATFDSDGTASFKKQNVRVFKTGGRAIIEFDHDDGQWWAYGVTPGGVAAAGEDPDATLEALHYTLLLVLEDCASTAQSAEHVVERFDRIWAEEASVERWEAINGTEQN